MKKPHIFFNKGYWRVSPKPKPYHHYDQAWNAAHAFVRRLNTKESKFTPEYLDGQGFFQVCEAQKTFGRVIIRVSLSKLDRISDLFHRASVLRGESIKYNDRAKALNLLGLSRMVGNVCDSSINRETNDIILETDFEHIPVINVRMVPHED